jgi:enoyl-CoA hydratase
MSDSSVIVEASGAVVTVTLNRPECRNAVDGPTAQRLREAFEAFEADDALRVLVLTGRGGQFCAGADLKAMADPQRRNHVEPTGRAAGPMGPTRMHLAKPAIAAIEGHAVAGGLELALMCDLRVAARGAVFGVFCRRWGVPLVDGGTVRLPRIVGAGRALDMILTGRAVAADEALSFGLVNRVVDEGAALATAQALAADIAAFPQACLRADRASAIGQWDLSLDEALRVEGMRGFDVVAAEGLAGAQRFAAGAGRHGDSAGRE